MLELLLLRGRPRDRQGAVRRAPVRLAIEDVTANAIEVYVHRLRRKLDPVGIHVQTVRGLGLLPRQRPLTSRSRRPCSPSSKYLVWLVVALMCLMLATISISEFLVERDRRAVRRGSSPITSRVLASAGRDRSSDSRRASVPARCSCLRSDRRDRIFYAASAIADGQRHRRRRRSWQPIVGRAADRRADAAERTDRRRAGARGCDADRGPAQSLDATLTIESGGDAEQAACADRGDCARRRWRCRKCSCSSSRSC